MKKNRTIAKTLLDEANEVLQFLQLNYKIMDNEELISIINIIKVLITEAKKNAFKLIDNKDIIDEIESINNILNTYSSSVLAPALKTEFKSFIEMVRKARLEKFAKSFVIEEHENKILCSEMHGALNLNSIELLVSDKENICQNLYDVLMEEFGDKLCSRYSLNAEGEWNYYMELDNKIFIFFPTSSKYSSWTCQHVEKEEIKKARKKYLFR